MRDRSSNPVGGACDALNNAPATVSNVPGTPGLPAMNIASPLPMTQAVDPTTAVAVKVALFQKDSALARPLGISHILGTMREILAGIFTWVRLTPTGRGT